MTYTISMLLLSVILYVGSGIASACFSKNDELSIKVVGGFGIAAGVFSLLAVLPILFGGGIIVYELWSPFPFANFVLRIDQLAAFMVTVISILSIAASTYSFSYVTEYIGKGAYLIGFFMNLFIASMVMLMVVDNAFYFIIFFELMSLFSYFLVISEQDEKAVNAGFLYFLIAHAGSILIMVSFFLMYLESGSLDFESFRSLSLTPWYSSIVFLLAFFGFGAKAGMMPLHGWLPKAHPAAPSHASAMMSGVMVKIGVFGIIKVGVDLLGATEMWWGIVVLVFGAISAVLGVLYALAEHDIKRLLAYHTVENIGIILMGVGVGMVGISIGSPVLSILGFLGALYHLLNHAVFKGLLFLGAGAIIYRLHTKDMEQMGGLAKVMPWTALAFLVGCMAISALPPLNGFVSEWYTYQSLFSMSLTDSFALKLAGPAAIVMLAITGALAAMCFVKVYGICFCGKARSEKAENAKEVPLTMTVPMLVLGGLCFIFGVGAAMIVPVITSVANQLIHLPDALAVSTSYHSWLVSGRNTAAELSPSLMFILLASLTVLPFIIYHYTKGQRLPSVAHTDPWATGYKYEEAMAQTAGNFTQSLRYMFAPLYTIRRKLSPATYFEKSIDKTTAFAKWIEPLWDSIIIDNIVKGVQAIGRKAQCIQKGDYRIYCIYIIVALVALLLAVSLV